jgi:hypothetical protein
MNTHEETHSGYTVDIVQIFKMSRHGETERFQKVRIFLIYLHNLKEQNVVSNDNFSKLSCSLLVQEIGCFCGMVLGWATGQGSFLRVIRVSSINSIITTHITDGFTWISNSWVVAYSLSSKL